MSHVWEHGHITKREADELLSGQYFHNGGHYVQMTLNRLVKKNFLIREKRGFYTLGAPQPKKHKEVYGNQLSLF